MFLTSKLISVYWKKNWKVEERKVKSSTHSNNHHYWYFRQFSFRLLFLNQNLVVVMVYLVARVRSRENHNVTLPLGCRRVPATVGENDLMASLLFSNLPVLPRFISDHPGPGPAGRKIIRASHLRPPGEAPILKESLLLTSVPQSPWATSVGMCISQGWRHEHNLRIPVA